MDPLQTTSPRTQVSQLQLNIIRVPVLDLYAGAVKTATVQTAAGKRATEKRQRKNGQRKFGQREKWETGNQYQEKRQREFGQQQYGQRQIGGPLCYVKIYICILTYSISYDKTCFRAFGRKKTKEAT